ncbi:hypothetical protein [Trichlorobacter ammonificans]|uniref:Ig-like domain-containing protein n=1 Tax=Trichlorobacter ammonificans TaxID=2916410 RepID=A0ABN8HIV9_9BACT|nr:hypothetical protein [Trichlorobacter ammonificans]CAH2032694.1 exported protein of unknown function [Trichlorobacter ammonificans]
MYRTVIATVCLYALVSAPSLQAAPLWSEQYQLPPQQKTSATATAGERGLCSAGSPVEILSGGKWYPGSVRQGPDTLDTCLVSYDGYGPNWDEWVKLNRLRPRAAGSAVSGKQEETAPAQAGALPPGRYACYTFDAGQLNYTYTDIIIQSATRYAVGKAEGSYERAAAGSIIFKGGPLKDATGSYAPKSNGAVEIKLVFSNDTRASMSCSRAGGR